MIQTYKTQNSYQVDAGMNPEDNKASIDVVYNMIVNNDLLFKVAIIFLILVTNNQQYEQI